MTLPITIPNTFATATGNLSLSLLDANFTTVANGINGIGNGTNSLATVSITGGNVALTALGYVGAANTVIVSNGTAWVANTISGLITTGSSATKDPLAYSTLTTQTHGLGAAPSFVAAYMECTSPEIGYVVGDRINIQTFPDRDWGVSNNGISILSNATSISILIGPNAISLQNKNPAITSTSAITAGSWKVVAVPYKIS